MPLTQFGSMTLSKLTTAAIFGALALVLPAAAFTAPVPAAAQAGDALDQAIGALRAISTMRANFTQTDRAGRTVNGIMTLKRPGRIRFEYAKSENMLIVADGKAVTFIDYAVAKKQRWPIADSPLGALLNPTGDVKKYSRLVPTANPNVVSIEVKDSRHGVTITMIFVRNPSAPGGLELNSWVALDAQHARTTVRLSNQQYGIAVPDSTFSYREPRASIGRRN
jgi:outer membrane lipoprotein-sorting protein